MPRMGVLFRCEHPPELLREYARRVEAAGFDELWVVEDCFFAGGVATAATALAVTEGIKVGLGIAPAVARNAVFAAMEFAALARLHPGRFLPGIGHGVSGWMRRVGAEPGSALAALEETLAAVRALLRGATCDASGRHVRLDGVKLEHPPDVVPAVSAGVRGPKSLTLSGRAADGTILAECSSPEYVAWAKGRISAGAREAGRDGAHHLTVYALCAVDSDAAVARRALRPQLAEALAHGGGVQISRLGITEELAGMIRRDGARTIREEMPDEWIDRLAVVGTPEDCASAINRLAEAGADTVVLVPPPGRAEGFLNGVSRDLLPIVGSRGG